MYSQIINKIVKLGDTLPPISGNVVDTGGKHDWLTEKDSEIETELIKLIKTFPGTHSFYTEKLHTTFTDKENIWAIDPISNTINFIHGMPHYSVVLSHIHKGEVKFAVVYDPSNKELFTARKGEGAFLNNKQIHVSTRNKNLFFMIGPYLTPPRKYREKALKILSTISANENYVRICGSLAVHYAYVACGRTEAAISFNEDTFPEFAGKLLVEEAGGEFTDFDGNSLTSESHGIIASNGLVHQQIRSTIKDTTKH